MKKIKNEFEECRKRAICIVCGIEYKCLQFHIFNKHAKHGMNYCSKCLAYVAARRKKK